MTGMTTVFKITLRPVLILSKAVGIINITYTLEPAGLLVRNKNSTYRSVLELARMCVLLVSTYIVHIPGFPLVQLVLLLKFWFVIIAAKISERWLIKLINGIIEFDRKLSTLPGYLLAQQCSHSKKYWKSIVSLLSAYFVGFELCQIYLWPPKTINPHVVLSYWFSAPYITDYIVIITCCFYLHHLEIRYQTLIDFWKCVPAGLAAVPGEWTHCDIATLVEDIRLLHAELSELLNVFSLSYGPMLLGFFVFGFVNMLFHFFFMISINLAIPDVYPTENAVRNLMPQVLNVQIVVFMVSTIAAVSFVNEKRRKIVTYLRLYRISNLPLDIKRQVKMFMKQISDFDGDVISAYGFFKIGSSLTVSITVLLITGLATLIQMREHPIVLNLVDNTKSFLSINYQNI